MTTSRHLALYRILTTALLTGLLLAASVTAAAEPPEGRWQITWRFGEREMKATLTIMRDETGGLSGTWSGTAGANPIEQCEYQDGTLKFVRKIAFGNNAFTFQHECRITDGSLEGRMISDRGETPFKGVPMDAIAPVGSQNPIRLNTVGYLPHAAKVASVAKAGTSFTVLRLPERTAVLTGKLTGPELNADTGEQLFFADFTSLSQPGSYCLEVADVGTSPTFRVAADVYRASYQVAVRAMYLWRCGTAVRGEYAGDLFAHDACHTHDAALDYVGQQSGHRDGTGGWHDAGDYNKYVVNAGVTVGAMLQAWERFAEQIKTIPLDLPDADAALPEYLQEVKWELDWLLKMQADDGRVYHKLSTLQFGGFIMPEDEDAARYFTPWSSAATADFVAMLGMAARIYRPYDEAFARKCLDAAQKSYRFLTENPEDHQADLQGFSTGAYQTRDADDRLWAAAEMWETTGEASYLADFEARAAAMRSTVSTNWDWGNVGNLGAFTYVLSQRPGRTESLLERIQTDLVQSADEIVRAAQGHGYARPMGTSYYWGVNGTVARQTMNLTIANLLQPDPKYTATSLDALHHLLGRNVFGRSFVTGLGHQPPLHPHSRRSGADDVDNPWPGYLVGGANPGATDWYDKEEDYRTNEIAINWNGALIYALAAAVAESTTPGSHCPAP